MDPCSQGLLGACLAGSFSKKEKIRIASFFGAVGGMAPDLDIFIKSSNDPLIFLEYHRHFSHSLAFIPIGGLIVSIFLYFFFKNKTSFKFTYIYTTLGILTHGLLDACTSYGTSLFWPFSDSRITWNIISIIDPFFTISLLIFLILSLLFKSFFTIRIGIITSFFYLIFGLIKHEKVKFYITDIASGRGHKIERLLLNPTIGNNILWRSVYQSGNDYYIDAIYMPIFDKPIIREGLQTKVINKETVFKELGKYSIQREDIRRFSYFSQDYIYLHPDYENVIADLRYGTLPYDNKSLWGIEVDLKSKNKHVVFRNLRNFNNNHYVEFWNMLKGNFK